MTKKEESLVTRYTPEYNALKNAIYRCTKTNHPQYNDYGGRGIYVDEAFLHGREGFAAFLAEVGPKPDPSLTLDRVDNSKGYVPGNLTWSSRTEQQRNRRNPAMKVKDLGWGLGTITLTRRDGKQHSYQSPIVPLGDRVMTLKEWEKELGVSCKTLRQRLQRGMTPEQALTPTLFRQHKKPTIH